ncbi:C25 family cysteine peptidase, partial [Chitinispirillales bacterium ANBcel5]|uniref:C25 family cysteine peptidase n=1 Tax=Cellulosispirillum alkaliphilum TaxID=3039283 RepID=UPI002A50B70B|nr:C25 family cysteine peptidase [Chitinispirillales bacterium ANBcel5]
VWNDTGGLGVRYFIASEESFISIADMDLQELRIESQSSYHIEDLRNGTNHSDYLIITHPLFNDAAVDLASHKESMGFFSPRIVFIEDVYRHFSGGNTDPVALRNFLLYVNRYWSDSDKLDYVVLFGSGHYDYKKIRTGETNFLPTAQINGVCKDLFFVLHDPGRSINNQFVSSFFLGRLPVKNAFEAQTMVDKIIETEKPGVADFGPWRNRVLMVTDDDVVYREGQPVGESINHLRSTEKVMETMYSLRPYTDERTVNLFEYETNARFEKPGATRALINEVNSGVAVVNFFGHGSADVWTDEHIFTRDNLLSFYNQGRYALINSFSCTVGKFDKPDSDGLSSLLVKLPGAGAIATVSATREVFASQNEALALSFYSYLFDTDYNNSIGASFVNSIARSQQRDNFAYGVLGDPSIRLNPVQREIQLEVQNNSGENVDSLKALQQVTVKGTVTFPNGTVDESFGDDNGLVQIGIFNPHEKSRRKDGYTFSDPEYLLPGAPVFLGQTNVNSGTFEQTILLPQNLTFDTDGVMLSAYAWQDSLIGAGSMNHLIFSGTDQREITDTTGPQISIRPVYESGSMDRAGMFVANRITSTLPLRCEVLVRDESGIDVAGIGPDEGLTMEVKESLSRRNINHQFQFDDGDFRRGVAAINFEQGMLRTGTHELVITARDLLGNISRESFTLEIIDEQQLRLDNV